MSVEPSKIVDALLNDYEFCFKDRGANLIGGTCPDCGKKEVSISKAKPFQIFCNRKTKCGYTESTRSRYPDLWENLTKRAPATLEDPNATARLYLTERGFNTGLIANLYHQAKRTLPTLNGDYVEVEVCRFALPGNHYQDRVMNADDLARVDSSLKAPFSKGFQYSSGKVVWVPPSFELNPGDTCFIVEGIFHAIALMHIGVKAIAAFSSNTAPEVFINQHKDLNLTWVIAFDDDPAGHKGITKSKEALIAAKQKYKIALTGSSDDWDDVLKKKKLDANFIQDSLWRGDVFNAPTIQEKAYFLFLRNNRPRFITDYKKRLYQLSVDAEDFNKSLDRLAGIDEESNYSLSQTRELRQKAVQSNEGQRLFLQSVNAASIAECHPIFLYSETEKMTQQISYYFEVHSPYVKTRQIALTGKSIDSPSSLNSALKSHVPSSGFDGSAKQLKEVERIWYSKGVDEIQTVPFLGYDKDSGYYLFPTFAYKNGRRIPVNKHNFIRDNKTMIKTTFKTFPVVKGQAFKPFWFDDFKTTFNANGLVVLSFWLGSLFAEQIRGKHSSFPFLEMSGQPGTGKSTALEFLWKLTGRDDYEGFDPSKATFAGRAKTFIQAANLPVVLIESDRDKDSKQRGFDYNELKTAYNGRAVRTMGAFTRGNETIEPPFRGTIVLAQNSEIEADQAVLERIVHLEFTKAHFSQVTKKLSKKIENTACEDVAGFFEAALGKEKEILAMFFEKFEMLEAQFTSSGRLKNGRIVKNHAQIAALGHCLTLLFPQVDIETTSKLTQFIEARGEHRERRLVSDHPIVQQFWETLQLLEDTEVELNHSKNDALIAINLPEFEQKCKTYGYGMPPQSQLKALLKTSNKHKFVGQKAVDSKLRTKTYRCWVFEA